MLDELCKKMTNRMLWVIVTPTAILILMLSCLIGAYTYVVLKSDKVSYEGSLGKFTASANSLDAQLKEALATNEQLRATVSQLEKLLNDLTVGTHIQTASHQQASGITNGVTDIANNLKLQSNLIADQKKKLEAISRNIVQFKHDLSDYPERYKDK